MVNIVVVLYCCIVLLRSDSMRLQAVLILLPSCTRLSFEQGAIIYTHSGECYRVSRQFIVLKFQKETPEIVYLLPSINQQSFRKRESPKKTYEIQQISKYI